MNVVAFLAIAAHMCSAYQVFAQPVSMARRLALTCALLSCSMQCRLVVSCDYQYQQPPHAAASLPFCTLGLTDL